MWRVYYGDGSVFSSEDGPPELAPARDVQVILQSDPDVGFYLQSGSDYYVFQEGRFVGVDRFGFYDYMVSPGWKFVLFGRTITSEEYRAVFQRALADKDTPPKGGFKSGERQPK